MSWSKLSYTYVFGICFESMTRKRGAFTSPMYWFSIIFDTDKKTKSFQRKDWLGSCSLPAVEDPKHFVPFDEVQKNQAKTLRDLHSLNQIY